MTKLFLDDLRNPPDNTWQVVRSYDAFVGYIETYGVPDLISFDHDLAFEHYSFNSNFSLTKEIPYHSYKEKTGLDCVKYLIEKNLSIKSYKVHSANPVGAENIRSLCKQWKEFCESNQSTTERTQ